jgi:hypothetical protein
VKFVLFEALPWRVADGVIESVHIAGGGRFAYSGLRGFTDWRAGLQDFPLFTAAAGYTEGGWSGGAIPQVANLNFFPSDDAFRDTLVSRYLWPGATFEVRSGDDEAAPGTYIIELTGAVAALETNDGALTFTVADLGAKLNYPVCTATFAGTGGIEGPAEAEGRTKRRSWGVVRNVEGFLLDKPNNIYEFGDPAQPLNSFLTVRDMGRDASPAPAVIAWQGSIAATLAALQAATPTAGSCTVAPSIACVKWWTVPHGPLTADIQGEVGTGYVDKIADIATRIATAAGIGLGPDLLAPLNGQFSNDVSGWTVDAGTFTWVAGGKARLLSNGVVDAQVRRAAPMVLGRSYKLTVKVDALTAGGQFILEAGDNTSLGLNAYLGQNIFATGTVTATFTHSNGAITNPAVGFVSQRTAPTSADVDFMTLQQSDPAISATDVATINAIRAYSAGLHVADNNETFAQALDRLLIPCNVLWGVNPDGAIRLAEARLTNPVEVLSGVSVNRVETYKPIRQVTLGYHRNHRQHADGEISAFVLAGDVAYDDVTGATKPENNATIDVSLIVASPINVFADSTGAPKAGEISKVVTAKLRRLGAFLTSGVTWTATLLSGNATFTISGTGTATLTITGPNDATLALESVIQLKGSYAGVERSVNVSILRQDDPPTNSGAGGTNPGTTASTTTLGATSGTTYGGSAESAILRCKAGTAGQVVCTAPLTFKRTPGTADGETQGIGKWQWRVVGGSFADITTEVSGGTAQTVTNSPDPTVNMAGSLSVNMTKTGLTSGTDYEFKFLWRRADISGTANNVYRTAGTLQAAGS